MQLHNWGTRKDYVKRSVSHVGIRKSGQIGKSIRLHRDSKSTGRSWYSDHTSGESRNQRGHTEIQVHAENRDILCLLLHFFQLEKWKANIAMVFKYWNIDIEKSATKPADLLEKYILNAHALSGCDTVPTMYGIGKKDLFNPIKSSQNLHRSDEQAVMHESKLFVAACYSTKDVKWEKQSSINRELL